MRCLLLLLCPTPSSSYFRPGVLRRVEPLRWCTALVHEVRCAIANVQELQVGRDVDVRLSAGKGLGAFACRPLAPGTAVGRYDGILRRNDETYAALMAGATSNDYAFNLGNGWVVDGEFPERSNWLRYINHSKRRANCMLGPLSIFGVTYGVFVKTCKPINAGDELLFDYGPGAANKLRNRLYPAPFDPRRIIWDVWESTADICAADISLEKHCFE
ncbi:hypothetical protein AB1Y20_007541 [Prymnesium parvum]|uniref:SET domain-containing protein n=1 Tax=Prymnesium parvum TaxID=97485 RepID=A0AB34IVB0_PRYPA